MAQQGHGPDPHAHGPHIVPLGIYIAVFGALMVGTLLTVALGFTGQLLRWDQTAYWSVFVLAQQVARTPIIGPTLTELVLAGNTVNGATLARFYAFHVFFIPALVFAFVGLQSVFTSFFVLNLTEALGRDLATAGLAFSIAQFAAIPARIGWGWIASRFIRPRLLMAILGFTMSLAAALMTTPLVPDARMDASPGPGPPSIVMDLVMVTAPKPPGSIVSISPRTAVFEIAPANVLHGAVREHGLASSPTPETHVRVATVPPKVAMSVRRGGQISPATKRRVVEPSSSCTLVATGKSQA